ncbi:MAG TPA: hypothetical protein VEG34_13290 [Thermoanaerobaculia bacterium]|nr:hypothetical protein [Thermoanaerobaculia bacterium]
MSLMKPLPPSLAVLLLLCSASLVQGAPVPGERWSPVGPQGGTITALAVAPSARRTLYAGTAEGVVFRSEDAGANWAYAGGVLPEAQVADLDVDPHSPATVYAAICLSQIEPPFEDGGLFKTTDGGRTWRPLDLGLTFCTILEVAVDPFEPSTLFAATLEGLLRSDDAGATWQRSPGFPSDPLDDTVTAVAFEPAMPGTLYAIHRQLGLHKSVDGGATWTALGTGLPAAARDLLGLEIDPRTPAPSTSRLPTHGRCPTRRSPRSTVASTAAPPGPRRPGASAGGGSSTWRPPAPATRSMPRPRTASSAARTAAALDAPGGGRPRRQWRQ